MYINHTMRHNFGGFTLDTASISNTSTSKTKITLPYTGKLPADLNNTTSAAIVITLQVGLTVKVLLTGEQAGKKLRYPITATPEEIDHILQGFFSQRMATPGAIPAWISILWDCIRGAMSTGSGSPWRRAVSTICSPSFPPQPSSGF